MIAAFKEFKSITEWSLDDRCVVPYKCSHKRLKNGWNAEVAITKTSS